MVFCVLDVCNGVVYIGKWCGGSKISNYMISKYGSNVFGKIRRESEKEVKDYVDGIDRLLIDNFIYWSEIVS